jgi:hypothetical protein
MPDPSGRRARGTLRCVASALLLAFACVRSPLRAESFALDLGPGSSDVAADAAVATSSDTANVSPEPDHRLPFLKELATEHGAVLPRPFGLSAVITRLGGRQVEVTDLRLGTAGGELHSVSDFVSLGSTSNVFNANLKADAWLLPFLNVYALAGYVHNISNTTLHVKHALPGGEDRDIKVDTELSGAVGGVGITVAGGYKNLFVVADCNYSKTGLGFDDKFTALIASLRMGYGGKIGRVPLQVWLGVSSWDTANTAKSHVDLENGSTLVFEADQGPLKKLMYDVGGNFELERSFHIVADVGVDGAGGYFAVLGPTYRF